MSIYEHMQVMMELLGDLVVKSAQVQLGPADGALYMQLCSTVEAWAKVVERSLDGTSPGQCNNDPGSDPAGNSESQGH